MGDHSYATPSGSVCAQQEVAEYPLLKDWLPNPLAFRYHVCQYEEVPSDVDHTTFHATVRVEVSTVEQAKEWVSLVNASSGVTWRVDFTRPVVGRRVLFNATYRCQHQLRTTSTRSKNTNCEAKMQVIVRNMSNDPHMPSLPMEVRISNCHNHHLHVAEALRYRDVGEKAKEILTGLFAIGHGPTAALAMLQQDLLLEDAEHYYQNAANREVCPDLKFAQRYGKYLKYTEKLYSRRQCWALSYRGSLLTRGNNTNNFAEAAMRVLKDRILQRTKAFNPPQLFDLLTSRLEVYYKARIVDFALGRPTSYQRSRFLATESNIPASQIQQIEEKKFTVQGSKEDMYLVDMDVELCSCPAGQTGVICKHLTAVGTHFAGSSSLLAPKDAATRAELLKLTGANVSLDFLQPLRPSQPVIEALPDIVTAEGTSHPDDPEALPRPSTEGNSDQGLLEDPDAIPGPSAATSRELLQEPDGVSLAREIAEVLTRCGQDPLFAPGLASMARQLERMQSNPSKLLSALHRFGKSGGLTSKSSVQLRRAAKRQGPQICVQPTAGPRRKQKSGSRSRVPAGRPGKTHSLSSAVADNISLAKKH